MKTKLFASLFGFALCASLLFSGITAKATAISPNRVNTSRAGRTFNGTVYCQPSYLENGKHAARGCFNWDGYDKNYNRISGTVKVYTPYGKGPNDSNIYSASKKYSAPANAVIVLAPCGFSWVPDKNGVWPANLPDTSTVN